MDLPYSVFYCIFWYHFEHNVYLPYCRPLYSVDVTGTRTCWDDWLESFNVNSKLFICCRCLCLVRHFPVLHYQSPPVDGVCVYLSAWRYEYHWCDGINYKKPTKLPAPQYIELLMDWVETQINNEELFPVRVGKFFYRLYANDMTWLTLHMAMLLPVEHCSWATCVHIAQSGAAAHIRFSGSVLQGPDLLTILR